MRSFSLERVRVLQLICHRSEGEGVASYLRSASVMRLKLKMLTRAATNDYFDNRLVG